MVVYAYLKRSCDQNGRLSHSPLNSRTTSSNPNLFLILVDYRSISLPAHYGNSCTLFRAPIETNGDFIKYDEMCHAASTMKNEDFKRIFTRKKRKQERRMEFHICSSREDTQKYFRNVKHLTAGF